MVIATSQVGAEPMQNWLKYLVVPLTLLLVLLGAYYLYSVQVVNPRVAAELVAEPDGPRAERVMLLTIPNERVIPVNYLREESRIFVGADGPWWRAFLPGDVPVQMFIRGEELRGVANVVDDDPDYVKEVFARLRPDVPDWLPSWADAKLVVITLSQPDS